MTISVPLWPIAVALLIPTSAYLFLVLTHLPQPRNTIKTEYGLTWVAPGPLKTRIDEIYPEDALGKAFYAILPYGRTKYSISGPDDGRKVILIHGGDVPSIIFKDIQNRLIAAGFRVLTYDLYGRGYSDAPYTDLTLPVYITQLALLMQYIGWDKARIVGISLGGAIAAGFAAQFPYLVDSDVALLASVGTLPSTHRFSRSDAFFSLPFVVWVKSFIPKGTSLPPPPRYFAEAMGQLRALQTMTLPHDTKVFAMTVRHGPMREMDPIFATLGDMPIRTLLVHGVDDGFVNYHRHFNPNLTRYFPKAKIVALERAYHDLTVTHPEAVANALIEFFNGA
ncbi:alpha/beta-hydrolase [Clavulina sp. PMI_390]|nr:alpha/beta-hydrolase [Clavulina sp. PMI_390]